MFQKYLQKLTFTMAILIGWSVNAQEVKVGGHLGAIGVGSSSGIGFGGSLQIAPYETVGLRLAATFASIDSSNYFSMNPMLVWFVPTSEEFKAGLLFGGGFHKIGNLDMKFGIGGGAQADFNLSQNLSVGGIFEMHNVFDSSQNVWSMMLTVGTKFGEAGGWDW
jgi:hypothetical protein